VTATFCNSTIAFFATARPNQKAMAMLLLTPSALQQKKKGLL
jgi:hypothetical protein